MNTKIRRHFLSDSATSRVDLMPWDMVENEAKSYASPQYDLSKHEDRQRCWFSHLVDSYAGGPGLFYQTYDVDREGMEGWLYRGQAMDEHTIKQLSRHKEEFDQLAANDEFWARLNVLGAASGK